MVFNGVKYHIKPIMRVYLSISLQAPPSPGEKRFLGEIVKAFGLRDYDKGNAETRLKRVIQLVEKCKVKMLIIDEIVTCCLDPLGNLRKAVTS